MNPPRNWIFIATVTLHVLSLVSGDDNERGEDGILRLNYAWGLRSQWGSVLPRSANFPEGAPSNMLQTWRIELYPSDPGTVKLICSKIHLPQSENGNCKDYSFKIEYDDDGKTHTICQDTNDVVIYSRKMKLYLTTGPESGAYVDCFAKGVQFGPDGKEVVETTTTPPPITSPKYLSMESDEIDSSEHGGPPGPKPTTCPCGWANKAGSRIIGGRETKINEYPFAVGLMRKHSSMSSCGGSIISEYHVITAAHCVRRDNSDLEVIIAEHDFNTDQETNATIRIAVEKVITHEKYSIEDDSYDIALLVLAEKIVFNKVIGPACIPSRQLYLDGQYVKAIGWGMTKPTSPVSPVLKHVNLRVVPFSTCTKVWSSLASERIQMCTYSRRQGVGRGDSGGPIVWLNPDTNRYTLVGMPSFVSLYGNDKVNYLPDVFVDFSAFIHWTINKIRENKPQGYPCWAMDY